MKKGFIVAFLLLICIAVVCLYPVTQNTTIPVSASFENTVIQVIHIENWKNWYPEIKEAYQQNPSQYRITKDTSKKTDTIFISRKKIVIHAVTPMSYQISELNGNSEKIFAFSVYPSDLPPKMNVLVVRKTPFIKSLLASKNTDSPLNGLKNYLEDPRELYGFDIRMAEIRDPTIATTVFKIPVKEVFTKIQQGNTLLNHYINQKNLVKTGHISISYIPLDGDSMQLSVGIPVNGAADSIKGVKCLSLPIKGRVLVGNYTGKFSNRQKIYQAMTKYLTDHSLAIPAQSFERYLNDSVPTSDSSEIKMELNYPVY